MTKQVYHIIYERFCKLDEKWFLELDPDKAKKLKLERDRLHKLLSEITISDSMDSWGYSGDIYCCGEQGGFRTGWEFIIVLGGIFRYCRVRFKALG